MSQPTPAAIMQIGTGFMGSKTLLSAIELGVFSTLANGAADLPTLQQKTIRVDQGSEFVRRDLDLWAYAKGVTLDFSRPGKPTDNAFIEAFNGRLRANEDRPHGAIGNKPPVSLMIPVGASSPPA